MNKKDYKKTIKYRLKYHEILEQCFDEAKEGDFIWILFAKKCFEELLDKNKK